MIDYWALLDGVFYFAGVLAVLCVIGWMVLFAVLVVQENRRQRNARPK